MEKLSKVGFKLSKVGFASCIQAGYTKQIAASFAPILFPKTNKKTDEQICEYIDRLAADFDRYTPYLDTLPARHVVSVSDSRIIFSDGSALRFDGFGKHRFFRVDKENLTLYICRFTYYDDFDEKEYNTYNIYMKV